MTPAWIITYAIVFVGGPVIVLWLLRPRASVGAVRRLGVMTLGMVVDAIAAQMLDAPRVVVAVQNPQCTQLRRISFDRARPGSFNWFSVKVVCI